MKKAFTLIEILIVVSILGILSAIVFPEFQAHAQQSREAAAKDNLRIRRNAIEVYAGQHNDVPPGYQNDDITQTPGYVPMYVTFASGNYLNTLPKNPFNQKLLINVLEGRDFPAVPAETDKYGWIYLPEIREIRLNTDGVDSENRPYFDY